MFHGSPQATLGNYPSPSGHCMGVHRPHWAITDIYLSFKYSPPGSSPAHFWCFLLTLDPLSQGTNLRRSWFNSLIPSLLVKLLRCPSPSPTLSSQTQYPDTHFTWNPQCPPLSVSQRILLSGNTQPPHSHKNQRENRNQRIKSTPNKNKTMYQHKSCLGITKKTQLIIGRTMCLH